MNASFRKLFLLMAFLLVLQLILTGSAAAQNPDRIVKGNVKDDQGKPVIDATVQIYRADGGYTKSAKTDKKGEYTFLLGKKNKPGSGSYYLGVRKEGYKTEYKSGIRPEIDGKIPNIEFKLTPGKSEKFLWDLNVDYSAEQIGCHAADKAVP
jgi:hypothetical protein